MTSWQTNAIMRNSKKNPSIVEQYIQKRLFWGIFSFKKKKKFRRGRNILHVHDIQKYVAIRYDIFPLLKKRLQEGEDYKGSGEEGRW